MEERKKIIEELLNEPKKKIHPNSLANLKPFEKGNKMSPGRPKGAESTKGRLRKLLSITQFTENPLTGRFETISLAELMDAAIAKRALAGDVKAYSELLDRFEGKVVQRIEQENTLRSVVIDTTGEGEKINITPKKEEENSDSKFYLEEGSEEEEEKE